MRQIPEKIATDMYHAPFSPAHLVDNERKDTTIFVSGRRGPCVEDIVPVGQLLSHPGRILVICVGEHWFRLSIMDFVRGSADTRVGCGEDSVYTGWDCHSIEGGRKEKEQKADAGQGDTSSWGFYRFALDSS